MWKLQLLKFNCVFDRISNDLQLTDAKLGIGMSIIFELIFTVYMGNKILSQTQK
jgi:hypothetical protein